MTGKLKRRLWFNLLILSYLLFSYYYFGGWWNSSAGSILIVFFSYLIWDKDFLKKIGLQIDFMTVIKSIVLAGVIIVCASLIMKYVAGRQNVVIKFTDWRNYYHDIFYILNEELVIGAILLFFLVDKKKIQPIVAAAVTAVFFALIHFVFYRWIFDDRGIIRISTLTTLFLIGFVRNSLILRTRHIGYSWALHFGWIVVMFGSSHVDKATDKGLSELERFNTYLGSMEMILCSIVMAGLVLAYWFYSCSQKVESYNPDGTVKSTDI